MASGYGLNPDQSADGRTGTNSRHVEVVVRLRRRLVGNVFNPHLARHVAACCNPVIPRPQVLAPIAFAQYPELAQQFVRTAPFQVLHGARYRKVRRDRHLHIHMVPVNRSGMHNHLMRLGRLAQQLPASVANVAAKHRVTILRHPNRVLFAIPNHMAATLVCFHPANLHRNRRDHRPPKGVGFTHPLSGTLSGDPTQSQSQEPIASGLQGLQ